MELRGQKKDIGLPMGYSALASANQESSSNLSSGCLSTGIRDGRRNPGQTLDHHLLHQQVNPLQQQEIRAPEEEDSNPNPNQDPDPPPLPTATITIASNSKSTPAPPPPPQSAVAAETTSAAATSAASIRYRECLKNHAASMGGHVVDGCGEFMPSGEEGTPEALKCAACDCHRSFHRKEVDGEAQQAAVPYYPYNPIRNSRSATHLAPWLPPPQPHHHRYSLGGGLSASPPAGPFPPLMVAFGGGAHAESSSEDLNMFHSNAGTQAMGQQPSFSPSKKRFRTKFTPEQKDKMQEFAERLGWKIQKQDEQEVQQFCAESGLKRHVFKVWMHNNKQAMKKRQL